MTAIQEICDQIKTNSDDALQAAMLEGRAIESANQGYQALSDVKVTLDSFVAGSVEVDDLLEEIQLLSQQVHILGVNAAIEAANAGDQGAGFSIIAVEMRKLASQVQGTALNIQDIMQVTGALANNTVSAIKHASESLELLEVSAELSVELTTSVAERALQQSRELELLLTERYTGDNIELLVECFTPALALS